MNRKKSLGVDDLKAENGMISVVITTYGRPFSLLQRAYRSAKAQSYQNKEIIIVNDNSRDSVYYDEINRKIKQLTGIIYISDGVNRGACGARNIGMNIAKGTYIAFLDDDDRWSRDKLRKQIKKFDQSTVMVTCRTCRIYSKNGQIYKKDSTILPRKISPRMLYVKNWANGTSCPLIRTEALRQIGGFDESLPAIQDYDCWLRLIEKGKFRTVNQPLTAVYCHDKERISNDPHKRIVGINFIKERYSESAPKKKAFLCTCNLNLLREYKKTEEKKIYMDFLKKTLQNFYISPVHVVNLLKIISEE
jgi:glycosyltransferase involved in cell wall biosynthesis